MSRFASAVALSLALLAPAAADAAAGPIIAALTSRPMACAVNTMDGTALKVRIVVTNTTGQYISKGSPITLTILVRQGGRVRRVMTVTQKQTAYNNIEVNGMIGFDQPAGAISCTARLVIDRIKFDTKPPARVKPDTKPPALSR